MTLEVFTAGDYEARVLDTLIVEVRYKDTLIDWPGPWGDIEGAVQWAERIVEKYSIDGHLPPAE